MLRRLLFQALTLSLFGLSSASALVLDEVEPNDNVTTANDASRTGVIRGVIEPGANTRYDYFRISNLVTYQYNLHAEVKILTGPQAGDDNFDFSLEAVTPPPYSASPLIPNSIASGNGSRVIRRDSEYGSYSNLFLKVGFPAQFASGIYEIRYTLVPDATSKDAPILKVDVRQSPGSDRVIVTIDTGTRWNSVMHRLTARADDHLKATIVSNLLETKYINTRRGPNFLNTTSFDMEYRMKLQRPVTRLVIIAEDSGGLQSRKILVFRRKFVSFGSSRFPKVD